MLRALGLLMKIPNFFDCDTAASYYIEKLNKDLSALCNELVDEALEEIPERKFNKNYARRMMNQYNINQKSTKVRDLCKDTCEKGN